MHTSPPPPIIISPFVMLCIFIIHGVQSTVTVWIIGFLSLDEAGYILKGIKRNGPVNESCFWNDFRERFLFYELKLVPNKDNKLTDHECVFWNLNERPGIFSYTYIYLKSFNWLIKCLNQKILSCSLCQIHFVITKKLKLITIVRLEFSKNLEQRVANKRKLF